MQLCVVMVVVVVCVCVCVGGGSSLPPSLPPTLPLILTHTLSLSLSLSCAHTHTLFFSGVSQGTRASCIERVLHEGEPQSRAPRRTLSAPRYVWPRTLQVQV